MLEYGWSLPVFHHFYERRGALRWSDHLVHTDGHTFQAWHSHARTVSCLLVVRLSLLSVSKRSVWKLTSIDRSLFENLTSCFYYWEIINSFWTRLHFYIPDFYFCHKGELMSEMALFLYIEHSFKWYERVLTVHSERERDRERQRQRERDREICGATFPWPLKVIYFTVQLYMIQFNSI